MTNRLLPSLLFMITCALLLATGHNGCMTWSNVHIMRHIYLLDIMDVWHGRTTDTLWDTYIATGHNGMCEVMTFSRPNNHKLSLVGYQTWQLYDSVELMGCVVGHIPVWSYEVESTNNQELWLVTGYNRLLDKTSSLRVMSHGTMSSYEVSAHRRPRTCQKGIREVPKY